MFEEVIPAKTKATLALLAKNKTIQAAYLAGGTACAWQLGHRVSADLDFFTDKKFILQKFLIHLKKIKEFKLERTAWGTILGFLPGMRFSFFYYPYPLLVKPKTYQGIKIADLRDVAAMKVSAISERGSRKDFIDLYFIIKSGLSLEQIFVDYDKKYQALAVNIFHIIKSLDYFADAETTKMPEMLKPVSWKAMKDFFSLEQKRLARKYLLKKP